MADAVNAQANNSPGKDNQDAAKDQKSDANESVLEPVAETSSVINPAEFINTLQNTFSQMQERFTTMMDGVLGRMDEMADRLNELEKEVTELVTYAGGITADKENENIPPPSE